MQQRLPTQWSVAWNSTRSVTTTSYLLGDFVVIRTASTVRIDVGIPHGMSWDVELDFQHMLAVGGARRPQTFRVLRRGL